MIQIKMRIFNIERNAQAMLSQLSLDEKLNILSGPGIDLEHYRGIDATNLDEKKNVLGVAGYINGGEK